MPGSIGEPDHRIAEARRQIRDGDGVRAQTRAPHLERPVRHGERRDRHLPGALLPLPHAAPFVRKGRPDGAGRTVLVSVVEVVDVMVVEVDGLLDEAEPEIAQAEIEIVLRVVDGGGDVVKA